MDVQKISTRAVTIKSVQEKSHSNKIEIYEWEYISSLFRDLEFLGTGVHFIFAVQGQGPGVFRNGSNFSLLFRNRDLEFSTKLVQEFLGLGVHFIIVQGQGPGVFYQVGSGGAGSSRR